MFLLPFVLDSHGNIVTISEKSNELKLKLTYKGIILMYEQTQE